MLYPEVQRRAQEEIDNVIGPDRLPTMQDSENLTYLAAVMKEILRWSVLVPLAIPHALITEDEYRGMRIPKGATVIANVWCVEFAAAISVVGKSPLNTSTTQVHSTR